MRTFFLTLTMFLMMWSSAFAVQPDEVLKDPALEARARELSAQMRCLVCQNQSIDDSDAPLAKDLRVLIRERLVAGDSDSHESPPSPDSGDDPSATLGNRNQKHAPVPGPAPRSR